MPLGRRDPVAPLPLPAPGSILVVAEQMFSRSFTVPNDPVILNFLTSVERFERFEFSFLATSPHVFSSPRPSMSQATTRYFCASGCHR